MKGSCPALPGVQVGGREKESSRGGGAGKWFPGGNQSGFVCPQVLF